ncbi:MAG: hypothetical protein Q4B22_01605 [Eubacteriales bacterium]|nr:hypothetical protein [Eubacteriales bacterium]
MSQKKVDYYKEQKKNRKAIMRREKMRTRLAVSACVIVFAALVIWFGISVVGNYRANAEANAEAVTTELDLSAIENYSNSLSEKVAELQDGETAETTESAEESVVAASSAE